MTVLIVTVFLRTFSGHSVSLSEQNQIGRTCFCRLKSMQCIRKTRYVQKSPDMSRNVRASILCYFEPYNEALK